MKEISLGRLQVQKGTPILLSLVKVNGHVLAQVLDGVERVNTSNQSRRRNGIKGYTDYSVSVDS